MASKPRQAFFAFIGLVLIVAILIGAFVAIRAIVQVLATMDSDIAIAIIAAAATIFVSVLSIVVGKAYEARAAIERENRGKKIPVYEELISFMFRVLMGERTGTAPTETELLTFLSSFNQSIMVWGADDVLAAWVKWRRALINQDMLGGSPLALMLLYEDIIIKIRRDLGHKNRNLKRGDILALFINDIDEVLRAEDG